MRKMNLKTGRGSTTTISDQEVPPPEGTTSIRVGFLAPYPPWSVCCLVRDFHGYEKDPKILGSKKGLCQVLKPF